jgi:hypothetical protein
VCFVDLVRNCGAFSPEEAEDYLKMGVLNGLFVLGRSIGLIAHFLDQKRLRTGLYRHPWDVSIPSLLGSNIADIFSRISHTSSHLWLRAASVKAEWRLQLRQSARAEDDVLKLQGVMRKDSILLARELLSDGYLKSVMGLACDFTLWHDEKRQTQRGL